MNTKSKTWIVVADAARARVFAVAESGGEPMELPGLLHAASRVKAGEGPGDRPGRDRTGLKTRGVTALSPHTARQEVEAERFAAELAARLRQARESGEYEFLAIAAPPRFLGLIREQLDSHTRERLVAMFDKELTLAPPSDLDPMFAAANAAAGRAAVEKAAAK